MFAQDIDIAYVSKRLGHINIQTTQNYYLELMPEKKAPARCRCFKSVKCFIRLTLICTNLHQKTFANVGISTILLTF
ncbi:hypothetical protein RWE15_11320 [Virgibacillus halophilus]|uniref:Phage integrase family protein n=1 Tax=Tigheibacillus halophilus TaxID=361280 RepID=A0ABU5C8C0_9BACI|nr:hypothetical protein [Virgibacillus halophilus]